MILRYAPALFLTIFLTQAAHASTFIAQCDATFGTGKMNYWATVLNIQNQTPAMHKENMGAANFELTLRPGGAAFADVMILKVSSSKSEFEVMSLLSSEGYGSVIYRGHLDGQMLTTQCIVNRRQN